MLDNKMDDCKRRQIDNLLAIIENRGELSTVRMAAVEAIMLNEMNGQLDDAARERVLEKLKKVLENEQGEYDELLAESMKKAVFHLQNLASNDTKKKEEILQKNVKTNKAKNAQQQNTRLKNR